MSSDPRPRTGPTGAGRSVAKAIGLTTLITAGGYGVTLLQQAMYARALGVNADTDALGAALAWAVGTTGLVGTTLATVFLPRYVRAPQGADGADQLRARGFQIALSVGVGLLALTLSAAPWLATALAPGRGDTTDALVRLLRLSAPLCLTWPLIWLAVSTANGRERYILAAASAFLPPIPVILVLLTGSATVELTALAYVVGTILQLISLWAFEPHARPTLRMAGRRPPASLSRELLSVGLGFALLSAIPLEVRGLASLHGVGAVAVADYASRLVLAGQQVLLSGLLAVTFTRWSRGPKAERAEPIDSVDRTLLLVAIGGVAIVAILPLVAVELTRLIFTGGRFSRDDAEAVGSFIGWMAPGVAGHMILMVAARALLAEGRVKPMIAAAAGAVVALLLVGAAAASIWGLNGVAAGYSAAYLVAAAISGVAVWLDRFPAGDRRAAAIRAFPIPPRDASLLAVHEDVR